MTAGAPKWRTGLTNHYAKDMHAATQDGKAYGFAFDDVADFASYIQDTAPTGFRLTLTPFQPAHGRPHPPGVRRSVGRSSVVV
ncbi:hypothetical protein GCM10010313_02900 [Streptomyces violarus]|uniref:GH64 domain-containing protein n=1 Tax=Streptomyces violarus TaxID=67380 RepID=A0A7W4ZJW2_9ACTN|nr:hypothetical protein [Streptomyces violarus]GHC96516.1 hypothetical protein GCM10010313_02900 [Streptomyces violarus]